MILAVLGAMAAEPGFSAARPALTPLDADPRDPLRVLRPGAMEAGDLFGGVSLGYLDAPWSADPAHLDRLGLLSAGVGAVLHPAFQVDLQVPLVLASEDQDGWHGPAPGDLRMRTLIHLVSPEPITDGGGGPGLALVAAADLPSGAAARHLGWGEPSGSVGLAATWEIDRVTLSADGAFVVRPEPAVAPTEGGRGVQAGLALGVLLTPDLGLSLESTLHKPLQGTLGADAGLTLRHRRGFVHTGLALLQSPGTAALDLRIGSTFGPDPDRRFPDADREGTVHIEDGCPLEPETVNGYLDEDGCPDSLSALSVVARWQGRPVDTRVTLTHRDTVREEDLPASGLNLDVVPGSAWAAQARATCLEGRASARAEEEGSVLSIDLQPVLDQPLQLVLRDVDGSPLAGTVYFEGAGTDPCVPAELVEVPAGGRTIQVGPGRHRLTASAPSHGTQQLTLADAPTAVFTLEELGVRAEDGRLLLPEPLQFASDRLEPADQAAIPALAAWMRANPGQRLAIESHTSNEGREDEAIRLSRQRAAAVVEALVGLGISAGRLEPRGFGPTRPIDTNRTASGRRRNERIEIMLLEAP